MTDKAEGSRKDSGYLGQEVEARFEAYGAMHASLTDPYTNIDQYECEHFAPWASELQWPGGLPGEAGLESIAASYAADSAGQTALKLLLRSGLDKSLLLGLVGALSLPKGDDFAAARWSALGSCFGEIHTRLGAGERSRESVLALCYLLEGTLYFGDSLIERDEIRGPAYGGLAAWGPPIIGMANEYLVPEDLAELDATASGSMLAAMCPRTSPDALRSIYAGSMKTAASNNPSLPPDVVHSGLSSQDPDLNLLFHPHADPAQSWGIIESLLDNEDWESLEEACRDWESVDEDGVTGFSRFQTVGPHASLLRRRIGDWCQENPESGEEILEMLNIGDDSED